MEVHFIALLTARLNSCLADVGRLNERAIHTAKYLFMFLLPILLFLPLISSEIWAFENHWVDYSQTYSGRIRVCHNEKADVMIDLPSEFLEKYKTVTLIATFESTTYTVTKKHKGNSFYLFQPGLRLNDRSFFGNYQINLNESDAKVTHSIELKTKYLKSGENKFTFSYDWRNPKSNCQSSCCGYSIYDLHFKEEPVLKQFTVSILSNPTGALVWIDNKHSSATPFSLKLSKGYHKITLEKEGYDKFEGKIYITSDREIEYDLESLLKKK